MYKTVQTGNTYDTVNDCLGFLFRKGTPLRETQYRVSLVCEREGKLSCVGDDLELASDGKTVKKRWWQQNDTNQRKLPFLLYHPATIVSLVVSRNGGGWRDDTFALEFAYGDEHLVVEHGGAYHCIQALRVHQIITPAVEACRDDPFGYHSYWDSVLSEQSEQQPERVEQPLQTSLEPCERAITEALRVGLVVTRTGFVYNKVTAEWVARDMRAVPEPSIQCIHYTFTMLDGRRWAIRIPKFFIHPNTVIFVPTRGYCVDQRIT